MIERWLPILAGVGFVGFLLYEHLSNPAVAGALVGIAPPPKPATASSLAAGGVAPSEQACPLDANIDAATAAQVAQVLSGPTLTDDEYDELSLELVMAGYPSASVCVQTRKLAGHPIA